LADLSIFSSLWFTLLGVRDHILGESIGRLIGSVFPIGFLGGWRFAVALLVGLLVVGAYSTGDQRRDFGRLFLGSVLAVAMSLYGSIWQHPAALVLFQATCAVIVFGTILSLERHVVDRIVKRIWPGLGTRRVIAVQTENADWIDAELVNQRNGARSPSMELVGRVSGSNEFQNNGNPPLRELGYMIQELSADTVVVCGTVSGDALAYVMDTAVVGGCSLLAASRAPRIAGADIKTVWMNGTPLMELTPPRLKAWQRATKRTLDILGAAFGMVVLSPLFAVVSIAIRLDSQGPVFFKQWRVGKAGEPFEIFKFRSMYLDAERRLDEVRKDSIYDDERLFKVVDDPRVTRIGAKIRKTSLDELPQLMNVLRGQMSLVGPRPPTIPEVALYEEHHYCRFDVKPGMTGPWQVGGRNKITDFEEVIRLERAYIRNWSMLTDFKVLLKTIPAVLRMDGVH